MDEDETTAYVDRTTEYAEALAARYRAAVAEDLVVQVQANPMRPVWLRVPKSVHPSGEVFGYVVGVATPVETPHPAREDRQVIVASPASGWVLVPLAAVIGWTIQKK